MGWFSEKRERFRQDWAAAGEALDRGAAARQKKKQNVPEVSGECSQNGCTEPVWQAGVCRSHHTAIFG